MRNKRDTEPQKDGLDGLSDSKGQFEPLNPRLKVNADKPRDKRPMPSTGKIFHD